MDKIYLIPGTGADERLFRNLQLDFPFVVIQWEQWNEAKTIAEYAAILSRQIDSSEKFAIIGVSFGGIVAIELSKIVRPEKIIIISSAKTYKELPQYVSWGRALGIRYLLFPKMIKKMPFVARMFGLSKRDRLFFDNMMEQTDDVIMKKTLQSILLWKNTEYPKGVLHLHGENDKVIPVNRLDNYQKIEHAGHFMIYQKGKLLSPVINEFLKQKKEL